MSRLQRKVDNSGSLNGETPNIVASNSGTAADVSSSRPNPNASSNDSSKKIDMIKSYDNDSDRNSGLLAKSIGKPKTSLLSNKHKHGRPTSVVAAPPPPPPPASTEVHSPSLSSSSSQATAINTNSISDVEEPPSKLTSFKTAFVDFSGAYERSETVDIADENIYSVEHAEENNGFVVCAGGNQLQESSGRQQEKGIQSSKTAHVDFGSAYGYDKSVTTDICDDNIYSNSYGTDHDRNLNSKNDHANKGSAIEEKEEGEEENIPSSLKSSKTAAVDFGGVYEEEEDVYDDNIYAGSYDSGEGGSGSTVKKLPLPPSANNRAPVNGCSSSGSSSSSSGSGSSSRNNSNNDSSPIASQGGCAAHDSFYTDATSTPGWAESEKLGKNNNPMSNGSGNPHFNARVNSGAASYSHNDNSRNINKRSNLTDEGSTPWADSPSKNVRFRQEDRGPIDSPAALAKIGRAHTKRSATSVAADDDNNNNNNMGGGGGEGKEEEELELKLELSEEELAAMRYTQRGRGGAGEESTCWIRLKETIFCW